MQQPSAKFFNLMELEDLAAGLIARPAFDYIARGAGDEQTLRETPQRVLQGLRRPAHPQWQNGAEPSDPGLRQPIKGTDHGCAMTAHGLVHPAAESETARGAPAYGTLLVVSTAATQNLRQIASTSQGAKWFQCYLTRAAARRQSCRVRSLGGRCPSFSTVASDVAWTWSKPLRLASTWWP
ncbi:hypothetical protein DMX12_03995 [Pseudomonas sp. MB-090624]|nr:hypothetical protein DMX12_03995 [Pseudomonas sp. MB-090624]